MLQPIHRGHRIGHRLLLASALLALVVIDSATAQTTAFTYQGKLSDSGNPVSDQYDFQFKLFDTGAVGTGTQQGSTIDVPNVSVTAGNFTVQLDFGAAVFSGAERFLEINVRPAGGGAFAMLAPRQAVTSTPYALRSTTAGTADTATNATQLGGLTASGFIQNTSTQQASTDFNIGGTGTANVLNAMTQFNLGGNRVLMVSGGSLQPSNIFGGFGAGEANTTGFNNSFFGRFAGQANTTGQRNSFFGQGAGWLSTSGSQNSFFGESSGLGNSTGDSNTFVGYFAGGGMTAGSGNTGIGASTGFGNGVLTNATAIGHRAQVNQSNSLVLGSIAGVNLSTANTNVGIGTTAPAARLHVSGDSEGIRIQGQAVGNPNGAYLSFVDAAGTQLGYVGDGSSTDNSMYLTSYVANVNLFTQIGAALTATSTGRVIIPGGQGGGFFPALEVAPSQIGGSVIANNLYIRQFNELASLAHVCWRVSNAGVAALVLTNCTSSLSPTRDKTEMQEFSGGLDLIDRLKPIAFKWKEGGKRDFGLNAEDVAEVEPLLVTRNAKGEVEEVKHDNLMVVFINAFKQQQSQIKSLQQEIETLMKRQQELDELKALVCEDRPNASGCKSN